MRISDWSSDVCSSDLVKTNVGHLEAAAGMAGLIKAILAIRYGTVPPNRHFETLNPHIALDGFPVIDRKSVVQGKSVAVRVHLGGRRIIQKKKYRDIMCRPMI